MEVRKVKCFKCGSAINLTKDLEQFSCMYCGAKYEIEKIAGNFSIKKLEDKEERKDTIKEISKEI